MPKDAPLPPFTAANAVPSLLHRRKDPAHADQDSSVNDPPTISNSNRDEDETIQSDSESEAGSDDLQQHSNAVLSEQLDGPQDSDEQAKSGRQEAVTDRSQASDTPEVTPSAFPHTAELPDIGYDTGRYLESPVSRHESASM